jgi:hypothetical protein
MAGMSTLTTRLDSVERQIVDLQDKIEALDSVVTDRRSANERALDVNGQRIDALRVEMDRRMRVMSERITAAVLNIDSVRSALSDRVGVQGGRLMNTATVEQLANLARRVAKIEESKVVYTMPEGRHDTAPALAEENARLLREIEDQDLEINRLAKLADERLKIMDERKAMIDRLDHRLNEALNRNCDLRNRASDVQLEARLREQLNTEREERRILNNRLNQVLDERDARDAKLEAVRDALGGFNDDE